MGYGTEGQPVETDQGDFQSWIRAGRPMPFSEWVQQHQVNEPVTPIAEPTPALAIYENVKVSAVAER